MTLCQKIIGLLFIALFACSGVVAADDDSSGRPAASETRKAAKPKEAAKKNAATAQGDWKNAVQNSAKAAGAESNDAWSRAKKVGLWVAGIAGVILFFTSLQYTLGLSIALGLATGIAGYVFDNAFAAWGLLGAIAGFAIGLVWYFVDLIRSRTRRTLVIASGNNPVYLDAPAINPTTGLPMTGGPGGVDARGNPYGAPGINPASGLPMAGGVDVGGNPYGTNQHP